MNFIERYIIASLDYIGYHYWLPLVDAVADAIKFHIQCWITLINWIRGEE
ncbi:hypothetical protein GCM10007190_04780 [Macrococcus hajekii]|nr:hypothetical protein [Macrococcus hajekii]GGA99759.1 hypothetical protein GCM10007190_04780 [Macrococcus hajekii]